MSSHHSNVWNEGEDEVEVTENEPLLGRHREDADADAAPEGAIPTGTSRGHFGVLGDRVSSFGNRAKRQCLDPVAHWIKGPDPPYQYRIRPFFPKYQLLPNQLVDKYLPHRRHKVFALLAYYIVWMICFTVTLHASSRSSEIPGYGQPVSISCASRYWADKNFCGLNGDQCRPFDDSTFAFRCPANCKSVHVGNPHAVGAQEIVYRSLVVGGPLDDFDPIDSAIYRGDSFICSSAVHSGFLSDKKGGCGVVKLKGEQSDFPSVDRHGISSIGFDSHFPMSFGFLPDTAAKCEDLRWPLLAVSVVFTTLLSIVATSPPVFFWSTFIGIFAHVALVSDPPSLGNYKDLLSVCFGRFLPSAFIAAILYLFCARYPLTNLTAHVEKTILYLGACWVGALNNYTFDRIPIQRLTPHDIQQQPGAIPALITIVLSIFFIALGQAWCLRQEGRMPRYLALYATMGTGLLLLVIAPGMSLRIHHYILALLLIPGTAIQTRPSLLYQGLLLGLFINGIARWGFDSILQTPAQLQGDAQLGTPLPTNMTHIITPLSIAFNFSSMILPRGYDGLSVLVNDVERWRVYVDDTPQWEKGFIWRRTLGHLGLNEYFRFAYLSAASVGDYTKAGTWTALGQWVEMEPGPSL